MTTIVLNPPRRKVTPAKSRRLEAVDKIDLRRAMHRLEKVKEWSPKVCATAEKWYRRFLKVAVLHPNKVLVPSVLVDEVWHQHVLDTVQYPKDCQAFRGQFFHHKPYFGSEPGQKNRLRKYFDRTNALYRREFGEDIMDSEPLADLKTSAKSCSGSTN